MGRVAMKNARQLLEKELKAALAELADLEKRLEVKGDYGLGIGDPNIIQWELNLALRDRVARKVEDIKKALERLDKGEYGVCEACGKPIEEGRLELLPYTTLCSKCAQLRR
ncbi:MAG: conjugal transfer protein TraR [Chloroflexi bacterium]|nr:MAG: conjugal transfer protein TraR [Chloroflexota bacterium]HDN79282.1 conjugal transfer protein TraR [Chloroflexota bacterium]